MGLLARHAVPAFFGDHRGPDTLRISTNSDEIYSLCGYCGDSLRGRSEKRQKTVIPVRRLLWPRHFNAHMSIFAGLAGAREDVSLRIGTRELLSSVERRGCALPSESLQIGRAAPSCCESFVL